MKMEQDDERPNKRTPKKATYLFCSSVLIAYRWYIFIDIIYDMAMSELINNKCENENIKLKAKQMKKRKKN